MITSNPIEIIEKPWGRELILMRCNGKTIKLLEINYGGQLSWQFHRRKSESLMLLSGDVDFLVGTSSGRMIEGSIIPINPGVMHRFTGAQKGTLIEISNGTDDDIVRMADVYGRVK